MLTALAYLMIIVFMALIMTKRLSAMVALILGSCERRSSFLAEPVAWYLQP